MDRIRFQLDEHIPHVGARPLRRRGIEVVAAADAGVLGESDSQVLARSDATGRVLVTHDGDFLRLHAERPKHDGIAYCRYQGACNGYAGRTIEDIIAAVFNLERMDNIGELMKLLRFEKR